MMSVCALVISKDPDVGILERVHAVKETVDHLIVVDNGSAGRSAETISQLEDNDEVLVLRNPTNIGIASALNQGAETAIEFGYDWVLTLDQDSLPGPNMVQYLSETFNNQEHQDDIVIVAPRIIDQEVKREARFLRRRSKFAYQLVWCNEDDFDSVTTVITSGAMIRLSCIETMGGFREDFFIDYVDTEFCLRAINRGYRIVVSCKATLMHQFGSRRRVRIGAMTLYPSFHPPERWYTISRNRIPMIRSFAFKVPHWLTYELTAMTYTFWRMVLTEDRKLEKIRAAFHGTLDGLRGKLGPPRWADKSN